MLTFIPRWAKLFNSFVIDSLPVREYVETPWEPELINPTHKHKRKILSADDIPSDSGGASSASDDALSSSEAVLQEPYVVPPDEDFFPDDVYIDDFIPEDFVDYPEYPGGKSALPPERLKKPIPEPRSKSARMSGSVKSGRKRGSP